MRKKLLAIVAALSLAVAFALPAFAASGISAKEHKLLDQFNSGVTFNDPKTGESVTVRPPASYMAQAENWLTKDELTDEEIKILSDVISSVYSQIAKNNLHNISEIRWSKGYNALVKEIQAACLKVGYRVAPTISGGNDVENGALIIPLGNEGDAIEVKPSNKPNQTGFDMTATVVSVIALVAVLSGSAIVISKKNLFAE